MLFFCLSPLAGRVRWDDPNFLSPLRASEGHCLTGSQSQRCPSGQECRTEQNVASIRLMTPPPSLPFNNNKNANFLTEPCPFPVSTLNSWSSSVIWTRRCGSVGNPGRPVKDGRQLPQMGHFCLPNASTTILPTRREGRMWELTVLLMDLGRLSSRIGPRSSSLSPKSSDTRRGSLKSGWS